MIRLLQILLVALPVAVTTAVVAAHAVNVPFMDQWELVPLLVMQKDGTLTLANLLHQHNEHRMLFPKLVMMGLAAFTHWDLRAEVAANVVLAAAALGVVLTMVRPLLAGAGTALRLWVPFVASLLLFSLAQWQNWTWGWQIQWFLSLFATLGAVALLARALASANPWPALAGAAAAVAVTQFSIASGVALWVAGLAMIALHPRPGRLLPALAWTAAAVASCAMFFSGWYQPPIPDAPPPLEMLTRPWLLLTYIGTYLAGPLMRFSFTGTGSNYLYGLALIAAVIGFTIHLLITRWTERAAFLPWMALAAFAGANALITGLGRAGFGTAHALSSRYVTLSLMFTLAAIALGILVLRHQSRPLPRLAGGVLAAAVTVLIALGSWDSVRYLEGHTAQLVADRACLVAVETAPDDCLKRLYPDAAAVRTRMPMLRAVDWSGFAGP